jgi:D-inositol-3-phosphate glycosyltransferase
VRIAILSYHTCPLATLGGKDTGGMNVYVRDLTRQLGRLGVHLDVFTRSQDEHVPHVLHDLGFGNRVVHVPAGPEVPLPKQELATYLPIFVKEILNFVDEKKIRYDLIHSHYWMSGIAARDLKAAWNVPIVHMFHTLGKMKERVAGNGESEGEYRIEGERDVLRISDRIISPTLAEFAQLQWLYQADTSKIVVIPPGVDLSRFYPIPTDEAKEFIGMQSKDLMLLFVGRIEPLKGVDTLIRALALMHDHGVIERHPLCLSIIGGDPEVSENQMSEEMIRLKELSLNYGLGDMITFLGKRSQDTLQYYYSAAEVVVVPSQYESFGMVALEAMACGTPVVASQVGGLAFLVQDGITGYYVPSDDPEALSARLVDLIEQPELREQMGARAAAHAQGYSLQTLADKIVQVYQDVLSSPNNVFLQ